MILSVQPFLSSKYSVLIIFAFLICSCNTKSTKSNTENTSEAESPALPQKMDSLKIDYNYFNQKTEGKKYLSIGELEGLGIKDFFPTVTDLSYWYLMDTVRFSDQFTTLLLGQALAEGDGIVYLANYKNGKELIDNRIVYRRKLNPQQGTLIYQTDATLRFDSSYIHVTDSGSFFLTDADWRIDVLQNGKLNFFPQEKYSTDTIATGGCMVFGFNGKYPIGEDWSILILNKNVVGRKNKNKVEIIKTKQHMQEPLFEVITLVTDVVEDPKDDDYLFVDIAFKGKYSDKDFDLLTLTDEPIEEYQPYLDKFPMSQKFENRELSKVKSFEFEGQKYTLAYILQSDNSSDHKYLSVAAICPDMELVELVSAPTYEDEIIPFRLKDQAYLYTINHTFAGAGGSTILYKIVDVKFDEIYDVSITCD